MGRAGTKVGLSDPAVPNGRAVAQQIKGTPGITGLSPLSVHSGEEVWHLDTLGCYTSNRVPTIRLITVNPSGRMQIAESRLQNEMQPVLWTASQPGDAVGSPRFAAEAQVQE